MSNIVKTAATCSAIMISKIVVYTLFGGILNLVFFLFLLPEISYHLNGMRAGHGGGIAALMMLLIAIFTSFPLFVMVLGIPFGFPIVYFFAGKKRGIQAAACKAIAQNKTFLVDYFCCNLFETIVQAPDNIGINEYLPIFRKKLNGALYPLRLLLKKFLKGIDFTDIKDFHPQRFSSTLSLEINAMMDEKILLSSNIAVFVFMEVLYSLLLHRLHRIPTNHDIIGHNHHSIAICLGYKQAVK